MQSPALATAQAPDIVLDDLEEFGDAHQRHSTGSPARVDLPDVEFP
jgi:hypothetical protein